MYYFRYVINNNFAITLIGFLKEGYDTYAVIVHTIPCYIQNIE